MSSESFSATDTLKSVLETACNGIGDAIVNAMKNLETFESHDNYIFHSCAVIKSHVSADVRLLAVISLKNVVIRYWTRGRESNHIASYLEKQELRNFTLYQLSLEDCPKVIQQLSALVARISRADWPQAWPELIPTLVKLSIEQPLKKSTYALQTLNDFFAEMKSMQLPLPRKALALACFENFPVFLKHWIIQGETCLHYMSTLSSTVSNHKCEGSVFSDGFETTYVLELFDNFSLSTGVLHQVAERAYIALVRSEYDLLRTFFQKLAEYIDRLAEFRHFAAQIEKIEAARYTANASFASSVFTRVQRALNECSVIPSSLQKMYPVEMISFIWPFLEFFMDRLKKDCDHASIQEPDAMSSDLHKSALLFLANVLSCREYDEAAALEDNEIEAKLFLESQRLGIARANDVSSITELARQARDAFFQGPTVTRLMDMCLHFFLPYTPATLQEWNENPEQLFSAFQAQQENDTVRSAAEGLIVGLLTHRSCSTTLTEYLVKYLHDIDAQVRVSTEGASFNDILFWEGIFLCAGLGASQIAQHINTSQWLRLILGPMWGQLLSQPQSGSMREGQQIMRHRLLWLLRCWFYQFESSCQLELLSLAASVLNPASKSDILASMEACLLIETAFYTCSFDKETLAPVFIQLVELLVLQAGRISEPDPQGIIVGVIAKLVQCMGYRLRHIAQMLVQQLATLWNQNTSFSPLKPAILSVFTEITHSIGVAENMLTSICELIALSCNGSCETSYLLKDGLSLWLALLKNLRKEDYVQCVDSLFCHCFGLIFSTEAHDFSEEVLRDILLICEAYALVGGREFLLNNHATLRKLYQALLCNVPPRCVEYTVRPLEASILACSVETSQFIYETKLLLAPLRACGAVTQEWGGLFEDDKEADVAVVMYLSLLARVALVSPALIFSASEDIVSALPLHIRSSCDITPTKYMNSIFRLFIDKFELCEYCVSGAWRQKLWVEALLVLSPDSPALWQWFPEVCHLATSVARDWDSLDAESRANRMKASLTDTPVEDDVDFDPGLEEIPNVQPVDKRVGDTLQNIYLELIQKDWAYKMSVETLLHEKTRALQERAGNDTFNSIMSYMYK